MKRHMIGGDLGLVEPGSFWSSSLRLQMMLWGALFLWIFSGPLAAQSDYEGAVAAKLTDIKWTQSDLQTAQRELAVLDEFLNGYEANTQQLASAREQLIAAHDRLHTTQQQNLIKLTIRMGGLRPTTPSRTRSTSARPPRPPSCPEASPARSARSPTTSSSTVSRARANPRSARIPTAS